MSSGRCTYEHYKLDGKHHFKIHLDPDDVLDKLKNRGYNNVPPDKLKEFMKDLKKLIKHDLRKKYIAADISNPSSSMESDVSKELMTTSSVQSRSPLCPLNIQTRLANSSEASSSSSSSRSGPIETIDKMHKKTTGLKKTLPEPPRHDPVALYHYYNKFWKQFNIPDENKQLKWDVRQETKRSAGDRLCF